MRFTSSKIFRRIKFFEDDFCRSPSLIIRKIVTCEKSNYTTFKNELFTVVTALNHHLFTNVWSTKRFVTR